MREHDVPMPLHRRHAELPFPTRPAMRSADNNHAQKPPAQIDAHHSFGFLHVRRLWDPTSRLHASILRVQSLRLLYSFRLCFIAQRHHISTSSPFTFSLL
ncbi:hypothetical protein ACS0TY_026268 [Phlomoides rotata]